MRETFNMLFGLVLFSLPIVFLVGLLDSFTNAAVIFFGLIVFFSLAAMALLSFNAYLDKRQVHQHIKRNMDFYFPECEA